jgi:hypothetical protein
MAKSSVAALSKEAHTGLTLATPDKKAYPLRISPQVLEAVQRWANDELRSVNAQIEYVLREALRKAGRIKPESADRSDRK